MKKKIVIIASAAAALIVCLIILLLAASNNKDDELKGVFTTLYFLNEDQSSIEEANRTISYSTRDDLTRKIIDELKKKEANKTIAENVTVKSITRNNDNTMLINLTGDFLTEDVDCNTLRTYALVKSVCAAGSVVDVSGVKVTVNGSSILAGDGEPIEYLYAGDVNLHSDMADITDSVIALYHLTTNNTLKRETYSVAVSGKLSTERFILERLAMQPEDGRFKSSYVNNEGIIDVETRSKLCFINLKDTFVTDNTGNDIKEKLAVYSMVNSLTELNDVEGVVFLINGKRADKFGSVDISGVLTADKSIVESI